MMIKNLLIVLLILVGYQPLFAQDIACSPERYTLDVFGTLETSTVVYGENVNSLGLTQDLSMDIVEPAGDTAPLRPLIIMAHGGSFVFGEKEQMTEYCELFAKKGYVAATIQYRLWSLLQGFPNAQQSTELSISAMHDMKAAVRYFYKQAQEGNAYQIDTTKIIIAGYSAGSITAIGTAYLDETDPIAPNILQTINDLGGFEGESGNQGYSSDAIAVLNFSGGIPDVNWINEGDIPIAAYHGNMDQTVDIDYGFAGGLVELDGSLRIDNRMIDLGIDHLLHIVEGGDHVDIYTENEFLSNRTAFYLEGFAFYKNMICDLGSSASDLEEIKFHTEISPNPSQGNVNFNWSEKRERHILIFDAMGKKVLAQNNVGSNLSLDLSVATPGLYFAQITHQGVKQIVETKKIIIE